MGYTLFYDGLCTVKAKKVVRSEYIPGFDRHYFWLSFVVRYEACCWS